MRHAAELARANNDLMNEIRRRITTQDALLESESRARSIFESAVDGVITFNEEYAIESVNPAAEKMFEYGADELKGLHIHHLVLLGDAYEDKNPGAMFGHTKSQEPRNADVRLVTGWRKNGEAFPIELTISQVRLSNRFIYTGIIRDVTERMKLDEMKREFVSVVSHELRTPLTSIRGSLALLNTTAVGELPPRAKSMVSIGLQNSERLLRLINDILDIEKIESGKMEFTFEPVQICSLIEAAVEEHRTFFDQYKVRMRIEHGKRQNVMIQGDYGRLMQVLANLMSNAAKFSPENGTAVIGTAVWTDMVRIWIKDEGPGIPEAFRDRIFQKFSQVDSSDTRKKSGSGLGLSIARKLLQDMDGSLHYRQREGGGACFIVKLPLVKDV